MRDRVVPTYKVKCDHDYCFDGRNAENGQACTKCGGTGSVIVAEPRHVVIIEKALALASVLFCAWLVSQALGVFIQWLQHR